MKPYDKFVRRLAASILWGICCLWVVSLQAQISEGGLPPSFEFTTELRSREQPLQIPVNFSVEDLKMVDAWRVSQGGLMAIAKVIKTDLSIRNAGRWITLPDGQKVWQLHIQAKDAIALLLYYSDFYIPEGGRLFIYNIDKTQVLGAYTSNTHPRNGRFATELIAGDEIILEYVPAPSGEEPLLRISGVGYGYNHLYVTPVTKGTGREKSGSCMVNINCEEGDDWQLQKKGVCHMIQLVDDVSYICTGSLVNNTAQDKKPYILTAFHCSQTLDGRAEATDEELERWMFVFRKERSRCDNNSPAHEMKTMVGCTRKAAIPISGGSDGLLLLLNQNIPDDYDVFFNGWDRTNRTSLSGVGIHHPSGDDMKISTYGNYPTESVTWRNSDNNQTGATNAHWNVTFDETPNGHGVTEGGSSGSPLFNQEGLIIGTLSGGNSTCDNPEGLNLYGKLSFHWNKFGTNDSLRMDVWLDPEQEGTTVLGGIGQNNDSITGLKKPTDLTVARTEAGDLLLQWKAPIYEQVVGWGEQSIAYQFGYDGAPFYYGQRWDTKDLEPIHQKTLTAVNFVPASKASYAVYIKQGNRKYEEDLSNLLPLKVNSVVLKEPFVIDARQDLIVGIHVKAYDKSVYPAFTDKSPVVKGKGNMIAMDEKGEDWNPIQEETLKDVNFAVSFTVTSANGVLPRSASNLQPRAKVTPPVQLRPVSRVDVTGSLLSTEGTTITAFPELTAYKIYRNGNYLGRAVASATQYIDRNVTVSLPEYGVSAVYEGKGEEREEESEPATVRWEGSVGNEPIVDAQAPDIQPRFFREKIQILNSAKVKSLEIYSADGKLMRKIPHPEGTVDTGFLPEGMYIFRLLTEEDIKTIQGIKH